MDEPLDDGGESERRTVDAAASWHGLRLDKVLVAMAGEFSRSHLQGLIEQGHVRVGGLVASSASQRVQAGQRIEVELVGTEESRAFKAEAMVLDIVHEDADVIVVNKPAGLVVHPAAGNWSGTLLNGLLAHHAGASLLPRAGIVHRLDKDTSGLMVVAKTLVAMTALVRAIGERTVQRRYMALCHGELAERAFSIEAPIADEGKQVMTWRNAADDLLMLTFAAPQGEAANVAISYQSKAQIDAMNARFDAQAEAWRKRGQQ